MRSDKAVSGLFIYWFWNTELTDYASITSVALAATEYTNVAEWNDVLLQLSELHAQKTNS